MTKVPIKLLFAVARSAYPNIVGGDGTVAHTLLSKLHKNGVRCEFFGMVTRQWSKIPVSYRETASTLKYRIPYPVTLAKKNFLQIFEEKMKQFRPNVVFSQLDMSKEILDLAKKYRCVRILCIHDMDHAENFRGLTKEIDLVLSVSKFAKKTIKKKYGISTEVFYPMIDFDDYKTETSRKYITMINPVKKKGASVAIQLAQKLDRKRFLFVEGWKFSQEQIDLLQKHLPNVKFLKKQVDMRKVYSQTGILIVPSICPEAFGRVVLEAQVNGIPVIASRIGGLPEAVGKGGILIRDYEKVSPWVKALSKMENKKTYLALCRQSVQNTQRFDLQKEVRLFTQLLRKILKRKFGPGAFRS